MCGLIGIISNNQQDRIEACNKIISHRGPDDEGIYKDENIALGHQRLSIIELSKLGHQPMSSSDGNLVIIFNGEIYNHQIIRKNIGIDYNFTSNSDTETILAGYKKYGNEIFSKLNGIFSLAIYNILEKKVILARDHFGVKPLYYYAKNNELFFGSEIKSFLKIPNWDKSIDYKALMNYHHYLYSPGTRTPFLNVKKFPPGSFAEIQINNPTQINITNYYDIPFNGVYNNINKKDSIEELDSLLGNSIERQLLSDVPVGFFLSGGLDSSLIVAKARKIIGGKIECFTIASNSKRIKNEGFTDDLFYARKVAKHLDVSLNEIDGELKIIDEFDNMIWHLDEPLSDVAPLHVLNISSFAKKNGFKVLLSGAGGDDLFSGYRRHQALIWEHFFCNVPNVLLSGMQKTSRSLSSNNPMFRRIQKIFRYATNSQLERMAGYFQWLPLNINYSLFSNEIKPDIESFDPSELLFDSLNNIKGEKNLLNQMLYLDMKYFLTDHNLNYTDKLSMATGVEVRVPYLDYELVNLSSKINPHLKMKGVSTKYILKKVAEKYLPKKIIYRKKSGFGGPIRHWINFDLKDMINDYLSPKKINERGIYNSDTVWKLINDSKAGKIDASYNIWGLLSIESWFQQFVDN